jgi:hypothetical protein
MDIDDNLPDSNKTEGPTTEKPRRVTIIEFKQTQDTRHAKITLPTSLDAIPDTSTDSVDQDEWVIAVERLEASTLAKGATIVFDPQRKYPISYYTAQFINKEKERRFQLAENERLLPINKKLMFLTSVICAALSFTMFATNPRLMANVWVYQVRQSTTLTKTCFYIFTQVARLLHMLG